MAVQKLKLRPALVESGEWPAGTPAIMKRIYAARGVATPVETHYGLSKLLPPHLLGGIEQAAEVLWEAIERGSKIVVSGDYDCDGATGTAVAVRGLRMLGATNVGFIIPDRAVHGYGLSPGLVRAMPADTEVIVTVDSGISSVAGVEEAKKLGRKVVITDHHLQGPFLPNADAMVNPNINGDPFPSKALAGVGVMFYVLLALRQRMRKVFEGPGPDLSKLLDLVALGTVADLVSLDFNNRILVTAGLRRMQQGLACPGINALMVSANKEITRVSATDIGFGMAPRLNAAGRLENMTVGVQALLTDDPEEAKTLVEQLNEINKERREKQTLMVGQAEELINNLPSGDIVSACLFQPDWHAGIVGLVASKVKDLLHRPTVAFAPAGDGSDEVRASGRSIPGLHLRDVLADVDAANPGMIIKFGGHAMAAGLSLHRKDIPVFEKAFDVAVRGRVTTEQLEAVLWHDGEIDEGLITMDFARQLQAAGPWGQGFPQPIFTGTFDVIEHFVMGGKHLKLRLADVRDGTEVVAVQFFAFPNGQVTPPPPKIHIAFEVSVNVWLNHESLQLLVQNLESA